MHARSLLYWSAAVSSLLAANASGPGPRESSDHFMHSGTCADCHSASEEATALRSPLGDDVSPHGTWKATMMANSFRDPYWRAQVSKEAALHPEKAGEIEALCLRCHAPMAHHEARLEDYEPESIESCEIDALAQDGVSCTICHQVQPDQLGTEKSFSGHLQIEPGRVVFGPYENPNVGMMRGTTGFTPRFGAHIQRSALCGSCHTLITHHGGEPFHEQTPYLEWRNSEFCDEPEYNGEIDRSETSKTCQECHMADVGTTRIARDPNGNDLFLRDREHVRAHGFVGGNAFMLDLMRANHEELELDAPPEAFARTARMTRRQLMNHTARVAIRAAESDGDDAMFSVRVENLSGHKLPTAYPARRVWLRVEVTQGGEEVFASGRFDADGRLLGIEDELAIPHYDTIDAEDEVAVWELVTFDEHGKPTTNLVDMAARGKDNRLLPRGWRADGPHTEVTSPVGIGDDEDFGAGGDTVRFRVSMKDRPRIPVVVRAWLHYQSVPPAWVDALRPIDTPEAKRFVRMYDAQPKQPEVLGFAATRIGR